MSMRMEMISLIWWMLVEVGLRLSCLFRESVGVSSLCEKAVEELESESDLRSWPSELAGL